MMNEGRIMDTGACLKSWGLGPIDKGIAMTLPMYQGGAMVVKGGAKLLELGCFGLGMTILQEARLYPGVWLCW